MYTFLYDDLTVLDQVVFAKAFQTAYKMHGQDSCWCLKDKNSCNHSIFQGFTSSKKTGISYRGRDARPLILSMAGYTQEPHKPIIVRRSNCKSQYCLNPAHYYWGTRTDVAYEQLKRDKTILNKDLINQLRREKANGKSSLGLSKKYKLAYHTVRRICNNEIYEEIENNAPNEDEIWLNVMMNCSKLIMEYPKEAKEFKLKYYVANKLECPWHQQGSDKHIGNFGVMGECLDCMEEIKKGRCEIDVRNFEYKWFPGIRRFWEQVDIRGQDECWPWLGATKKEGKESVANFPSPFHVGVSQAATRVAFWLSRGYTGKYRVFTKKTCEPFCCNPLHSTIRELKCQPSPKKIEVIKTNHDNIIDFYKKKKNKLKKKSSSTK